MFVSIDSVLGLTFRFVGTEIEASAMPPETVFGWLRDIAQNLTDLTTASVTQTDRSPFRRTVITLYGASITTGVPAGLEVDLAARTVIGYVSAFNKASLAQVIAALYRTALSSELTRVFPGSGSESFRTLYQTLRGTDEPSTDAQFAADFDFFFGPDAGAQTWTGLLPSPGTVLGLKALMRSSIPLWERLDMLSAVSAVSFTPGVNTESGEFSWTIGAESGYRYEFNTTTNAYGLFWGPDDAAFAPPETELAPSVFYLEPLDEDFQNRILAQNLVGSLVVPAGTQNTTMMVTGYQFVEGTGWMLVGNDKNGVTQTTSLASVVDRPPSLVAASDSNPIGGKQRMALRPEGLTTPQRIICAGGFSAENQPVATLAEISYLEFVGGLLQKRSYAGHSLQPSWDTGGTGASTGRYLYSFGNKTISTADTGTRSRKIIRMGHPELEMPTALHEQLGMTAPQNQGAATISPTAVVLAGGLTNISNQHYLGVDTFINETLKNTSTSLASGNYGYMRGTNTRAGAVFFGGEALRSPTISTLGSIFRLGPSYELTLASTQLTGLQERKRCSMATCQGDVFFLGGQGPGVTPVYPAESTGNAAVRYNPVTEVLTVQSVNATFVPSIEGTAVSTGGTIYTIGGRPATQPCLNVVKSFKPATGVSLTVDNVLTGFFNSPATGVTAGLLNPIAVPWSVSPS